MKEYRSHLNLLWPKAQCSAGLIKSATLTNSASDDVFWLPATPYSIHVQRSRNYILTSAQCSSTEWQAHLRMCIDAPPFNRSLFSLVNLYIHTVKVTCSHSITCIAIHSWPPLTQLKLHVVTELQVHTNYCENRLVIKDGALGLRHYSVIEGINFIECSEHRCKSTRETKKHTQDKQTNIVYLSCTMQSCNCHTTPCNTFKHMHNHAVMQACTMQLTDTIK